MLRHLALALLALPAASAYGEIPDWVKASAGWWAEGAIPDSEFLKGIEYLVGEGIIRAEASAPGGAAGSAVPDWVRTSAGWWAEGATSDAEFVAAIEHLIGAGIISAGAQAAAPEGPEACQEIKRLGERRDCIEEAERRAEYARYVAEAAAYAVGPVTFYYPGIGSEGNDLFMEGDQAILTVRMLAENTGSDSNVALACTGPSICSYDVWDGESAFKFSATDFTSGQIVLRPGDSRVFNMLFGPNIGYGGTQFEYDPSREYTFRISEPWGSAQIPLGLE